MTSASTTPLRPSLARLNAPGLIGVLMLALILGGMAIGYRGSERAGLSQLAAVANERLELYASTLETELARYAYLPSLIAIDDEVAALFTAPADAAVQERASRRLARVNVRAGALLIAVTGAHGEVLAASNGYQRLGPAGRSVLPALASPLNEDAADFFSAHDARGSTDYHFVQPVRREGRFLGLIIVRVSLAPLEATWIDMGLRSQSEKLLVVDEQGVVILSSVPDWKYRTLGTADAATLRATGRYPDRSFPPLSLRTEGAAEQGASVVRVEGAGLHLSQERPIMPLAVRLVTLSDASEVWRHARDAAWGGGIAGAFVGMLVLYLLHRRRALRQLFHARNALQGAHDQLERQVDERTRELRSTNEELKRQIAQRLQAEDELIQAGKLAVLGQMSAGISHEINQPLTALRALSRNTLLLLEGGRTKAVAENLKSVDDMVERMGRITSQLKSFARKTRTAADPVDLAAAVRNVLLLLEHRLSAEQVEVRVEVPDGTQVQGDINRLEQVLVNLATNALDAMAGSACRQLSISAEEHDGRVSVRVEDTGPGIDPMHLKRLFEPFFTTKPAGQGLGLGLVISSKIVSELGGSLRAQPGDAGMAFEFDLLAVHKEVHV
ncbi:MAG: sensor histidine kinase [Vitreoscilla sp.]|nr:sensor histidine kinase [Vitreoscilla sp.]